MMNFEKNIKNNDYYYFLIITIIAVIISMIAYFTALKKYYKEVQEDFIYFAANESELLDKTFQSLFTKLKLVKYLYLITKGLNKDEYVDIISSLKDETIFDAFIVLKPDQRNDYNVDYFAGRLKLNSVKSIFAFLKRGVMEDRNISTTFEIPGERHKYIALYFVQDNKDEEIIVGLIKLGKLLKSEVNWADNLQLISVYLYDSRNLKVPVYFLRNYVEKKTVESNKPTELSYYHLKAKADIYYSQNIWVGNTSWTLLFIPSKQYLLSSFTIISWLALTTALIIISLLIYSSYKISKVVSKLKAKSSELIESENKVRNIIECSVDGLITINSDRIIESFNPACESLFGYKAEEVIGKEVTMLIPSTYITEYIVELKHYMNNEPRDKTDKTIGKSYNVIKKDGSIFPIDLSISIIDINGRKIFSGIIRDITERKESDSTKEKLIYQLTENNMELEQFTYVASHDLQEPIRLISNYIGLLLSSCKQSLDEEAKKYLNICKDSTVRMHELVLGLLEYAKLGQGVEQFDRVDCNHAMSKALLNLQKVIKETNAKVSNNDLPEIYGKSIAITSLFQNLISNAIKYQKKNSVPQIEIEAKSYGQYWLFRFTDNGIGIDKQHLNKIFMPFKRVYSKYEFPGTGMGLAICKRIINRHQGEIWVESTLEQGSSFYFTIPKI